MISEPRPGFPDASDLRAATPAAVLRAECVLTAAALSIFVVICLGLGALTAWDEWRWGRDARVVQAEVVRWHGRDDGGPPQALLARYRDASGREYEADVATNGSSSTRPGEPITLRVLPGDPRYARSGPPSRLWLAPLVVGLALPIIPLVLWRQYRGRARREAALRLRGRRVPVDTLASAAVDFGKGRRRYAVVARWTDPAGAPRRTLAGPYHYDPAPLLDASRSAVLADPFDPARSMLDPDGLPALTWFGLTPGQRRSLAAGAR